MAACIGREFEHQLLLDISPLPDRDLKTALDRLIEAELIFRRGLSTDGSYLFKHALVRDAACESLLKKRRKDIHAKLLSALETRPDTAPELLASHAAQSENIEKAIHYWRLAGEQAVQGSAVFEAIAHFEQARGLLLAQPRTHNRDEYELELLKKIGSASIAARGYGAQETITAFDTGLELTKKVDRPDLLFPILYGQYVYRYIKGGGNPPAHKVASRILDEAAGHADTIPQMIGHRCVGMTLFCQGRFAASEDHFQRALELYRDEIDHNLIFEYGTDSKVSAQVFLAAVTLLRGFPERASSLCEAALQWARRSNNVHSLEYALFFGPIRQSLCLRDIDQFEERVLELSAVADENRLPMWQAYASTQLGWLLSLRGKFDDAILQLRSGLDGLERSGVKYDAAVACGQLAEAYLLAGRFDEGLVAAENALDLVRETNERWFEPEIHRLHGELLLSGSNGNASRAIAAFETSLNLARNLGAVWWELRTAISMARHCPAEGAMDTFELLREIYGRFSEGFDRPDLAAAKDILQSRL